MRRLRPRATLHDESRQPRAAVSISKPSHKPYPQLPPRVTNDPLLRAPRLLVTLTSQDGQIFRLAREPCSVMVQRTARVTRGALLIA